MIGPDVPCEGLELEIDFYRLAEVPRVVAVNLREEYPEEVELSPDWSLEQSGGYALHHYSFDRAVGGGELISTGNEVDTAPRRL